ncbi:Uncharacterised protein [Vibrio cholerae]|nr:Uncharacterised protein [Vibrio cholerae]
MAIETGWPPAELQVMVLTIYGTFAGPASRMACSSFSKSKLPLKSALTPVSNASSVYTFLATQQLIWVWP